MKPEQENMFAKLVLIFRGWHPKRFAVLGEIAEKYGIDLSIEIRKPAEGFKERPFIIITGGPPNLSPFWRELDSQEPVDPSYKPPTKWWKR